MHAHGQIDGRPVFPAGNGGLDENVRGSILNIPFNGRLRRDRLLSPHADAPLQLIAAALAEFRPDLVLFSAGFDAHKTDLCKYGDLKTDDYRVLTERLVATATEAGAHAIVSVLEGGYGQECNESAATDRGQTELSNFADCLEAHLRALMLQDDDDDDDDAL